MPRKKRNPVVGRITITTYRQLRLNADAFRALGEPRRVILLYEPDTGILGIRGCFTALAGSFALSRTVHSCSASAFFARHKIKCGHWDVTLEDETLIADLWKPSSL